MRTKDKTVRCAFHPKLTDFLVRYVGPWYRSISGEAILTSGSESATHHSYTSLHYADPCCAVDLRSWDIGPYNAQDQYSVLSDLAISYCQEIGIPVDWIEVILESDHIHIEFQPKRRDF